MDETVIIRAGDGSLDDFEKAAARPDFAADALFQQIAFTAPSLGRERFDQAFL